MSAGAETRKTSRPQQERGFTLIETMIAIVVLAIGVLGLAATFATGITYMMSSQDDFIAQQKAQEAVESVFTARDNNLPFASIANTADGGIFVTGPMQLCNFGPDGIAGTIDDVCGAGNIDCIQTPGPDGILGNADDVCRPLSNFARTIAIAPVSPGLNSITVTINYTAGRLTRQYQLTTYISAAY